MTIVVNLGTIAGAANATGYIATANLSGTLAVVQGGTGSTTASGARTNLGLATVAATGAYSDLSGRPTLATSATTDTTSATNITSGTLPTARLSGSYTGITGVGTLAAGSIPGSLISSAVADATNATTATNGAKAWVNFNGSTAARTASYNVDSITRNATGDYTVNITSGALSSANYAVTAAISWNFGASTAYTPGINTNVTGGSIEQAPTATACRIAVLASTTNPYDAKYVCLSFFQ